MKKNKSGIFQTNVRVPTGKKDTQTEDTNSEMTELPKTHVSITPSALTAVKDKVSEVLQLRTPGSVIVEFSSSIRDSMAYAPSVLTSAASTLVAGPRPASVVLGRAWDDEKKQRATDYQSDRRKYRDDTSTATSTTDSNFLEAPLKSGLMRSSMYTAALSRVRDGSVLDYWDTLSELLKSRVQLMKPGRSKDCVTMQQVLELCTSGTGGAMAYYDRTTELKDQLVEAVIGTQVSATVVGINLDPDLLLAVRSSTRQGVIDQVDGSSALTLKLWEESSEHSDYDGSVKFKSLVQVSSVTSGETPYTKRTIVGSTVTGGLSNLLVMAKESLDRLKASRPSHKVLPKRKEKPTGRDLKSDATTSTASVQPSKKQKITGSKKTDSARVTLESTDGVDLSSKSPGVAPCYFCRDRLCRFGASKTRTFTKCHYSPTDKGTSTSRKTPDERKSGTAAARPLRDLLGRQR